MKQMPPILYQAENSSSDCCDRRFYKDFSFAPHFHSNPELIYVADGVLFVTIDSRTERVHTGQFAMILPWQIHSFETLSHSDSVVLVFPQKLIPLFLQRTANCHGEPQIFSADDVMKAQFVSHICNRNDMNELMICSILYGLCHDFMKSCSLVVNSFDTKRIVFTQVMNYISVHYRSQITLHMVANELGYSYHYLSHLLGSVWKMSFRQLVNLKRIEVAEAALLEHDLTIDAIAKLCGFANVRTFNRAFLMITQMAPSRYRSLQKNMNVHIDKLMI